MTTVLGFGVLFFAILPPMKQFGTMTALTIFYSFLSSVWVLPSILVLWARYTNLGKGNDERPDREADSKAEDSLET
jgi:preprotein translocase subunit SecD